MRKMRAGEIRAASVGLRKPCAVETGVWAGGVDQPRAGEVRLREVSAGELRMLTIRPAQHGVRKIAAAEVRVRHARAGEDAAGKVAVFADTAVRWLCFETRVGAERPERRSGLARRNRP